MFQGYTEAQSMQELYATPAMDMPSMANPSQQVENATSSSNTERKSSGVIRVGVAPLNNKTDHSVSTDALRERLISELQGTGIEAPSQCRNTDDRGRRSSSEQCDFVLLADISSLKGSKVGGMFGRVTGVTGVAKTDARIDFRLFPVGESTPKLQSSATAKEEGDEQSAGAALSSAARMVAAAVKRG